MLLKDLDRPRPKESDKKKKTGLFTKVEYLFYAIEECIWQCSAVASLRRRFFKSCDLEFLLLEVSISLVCSYR